MALVNQRTRNREGKNVQNFKSKTDAGIIFNAGFNGQTVQ